jgi:hypothetical protein
MKIDDKTEIVLDTSGNCYVYCDGRLYDFVFDSENNITLDEIKIFDMNEEKVEINKLKNIDPSKTLKNKVIKNTKIDNLQDYDMNNYYNLYYENNTFIEPDNKYDSDGDDQEVLFCSNTVEKKTKIIVHDYNVPLYDILLTDNNEVYFKTKIVQPVCRLVIDKIGKITYRVLGGEEKHYNIQDLLQQ